MAGRSMSMIYPLAFNADGRDQHQLLRDAKAVDLDRQQVKPGQVTPTTTNMSEHVGEA